MSAKKLEERGETLLHSAASPITNSCGDVRICGIYSENRKVLLSLSGTLAATLSHGSAASWPDCPNVCSDMRDPAGSIAHLPPAGSGMSAQGR
jgi:hypothetical protein